MEFLTTTNTLFLITIGTIGVNIYFSLKKPQEKSEVIDAIFNERMNHYENTTNEAIKLALNHSHTVESKLDQHIKENQMFALETTKTLSKIETLLEQHLKQ